MRQLQHAIIARIAELTPGGLLGGLPDSSLININNFYGIEIDDFAHELAILSLFLVKHQMNLEFAKTFGKELSIIPLKDIPTIVHGNAARIDWQEVCPNFGRVITKAEQSALIDFDEPEQTVPDISEKVYDEIYLIGNPPYKGSRSQTRDQKTDVKECLSNIDGYKYLDYIAIWFKKGADYIKNTKAKLAFVSTNSITQGDQVGILWPDILADGLTISFAHTSFKWQNSARDQAGVTVVIIGLDHTSLIKKRAIFSHGIKNNVANINPYLSDGSNTVVTKSRIQSAGFSPMTKGSTATEGENLVLEPDEYENLIKNYPESDEFIKMYAGSAEYINGKIRYCLWIEGSRVDEAMAIAGIRERVEKVRAWRAESSDKQVQAMAVKPWSFFRRAYKATNEIIVPVVSSERRNYIPLGFVGKDTVISYAAFAIYDAEPWLFALLQSKMHMAWIRTVCGQLETRIRYSSTLGYNTFPINPLTQEEKDKLNQSARNILLARAHHPEKTLAEMYDPDKMPANLREAHDQNDHLVDQLYKKGGFKNDEERLAMLFSLYEQMTEKS